MDELVLCTIQRKKHQHRKEGKKGEEKKKTTATKRKKREGDQDAMAAAAAAGNDEIEEAKRRGGAKKRRRSKQGTAKEAPEDQDSVPVGTAPPAGTVDEAPTGAVAFSANTARCSNRLSPVPPPPTPPQEMMRMVRPAATGETHMMSGHPNANTSAMMHRLLMNHGGMNSSQLQQPAGCYSPLGGGGGGGAGECSAAAINAPQMSWFGYPQQHTLRNAAGAAPCTGSALMAFAFSASTWIILTPQSLRSHIVRHPTE